MKITAFPLLILVLATVACTPPPASTPAPVARETAPGARATWELEWERTLAEARKEGSVSIYGLWAVATRTSLSQAFKDKYGITLEFTPFSRGAEMLARAQTEQRAGLYAADIFGAGGPTLVSTMKPEGVLGPVEPLFLLPEAVDGRVWRGGNLPYLDKDRFAIGLVAALQRYLMYNTDLVKKDEITGYRDVLKPQFKGKITMNDPTVTGAGNAFMSHLAMDLWDLEQARDFLTRLIREQEVVIQRDPRLNVETTARGKHAVGLAPQTESLAEFLRAGAPLALVVVKEGAFVSPGQGAMAVPRRLAHPNAARVFINWLFTREGQTVFSKAFGSPSLRTDVPAEAVHPILLPQPGEKLFLDNEETIDFRGKMLGIAREVIEQASKK